MQLLWEESMPRYFFHVASGEHVHKDDVGQEFPSPSAALKEARLLAGELLRDAAFARRTLEETVEVADESGRPLFRFRCSDFEKLG
jgi:hypothetical protein